ncbi:hypothetical protein [Pedobacter cryoconitis]|uniref:Lipoprotein n=1 Tax=Pedobacter cryoconitis TaxID=188932 RepID=A0A7X0MJA9_9SPHI|nr:hypothetical protein [Pedobacter cryoconitis]MBB6500806.1 hypothetical protein [Pedobacter cryoconitis]
MKKYLLLLLSITAIGLSSCKKEVIAPNNQTTNRTILVTVPKANWKVTNDGKSWFTTINVQENDAYFNKNGHIVVAMSIDDPNVYEAIPQTYNKISYNFDSGIGYVNIYFSDPNGIAIGAPTFDSNVKITLIDSYLIP